MNEHSSRSHALLRVLVTGKNLASGKKTIGECGLKSNDLYLYIGSDTQIFQLS